MFPSLGFQCAVERRSFSVGCDAHPATFAPAGSSRSSCDSTNFMQLTAPGLMRGQALANVSDARERTEGTKGWEMATGASPPTTKGRSR